MSFPSLAEVAGNVCICLGVIIAIWQLFDMKKSFKADHERRKKQATIEFYGEISEKFRESLKQIDEEFPNGEIINVSAVETDSAAQGAIKNYLSHMEDFSVGINTGIYDIYIFDRMAGVFTITWFDRLREFIAHSRREFDSLGHLRPHTYGDFEALVSRLREVRRERFPVQERDFAKLKHDPLKT
jgi:hypothetical protein